MTADDTADAEAGGGVGGRIREWANVVAPLTLISALTIYFGYVGTRSRLDYFGVDLDLARLSNQDLLLSGTEIVYVPVALLFLAVLVAATTHAAVSWSLTSPGRDGANTAVGATLLALGLLLLIRGVLGLLVLRISRGETPGTTPLALALAPCLLAYGGWVLWRVVRRRATGEGRRSPLVDWFDSPPIRRVRTVIAVGLGGLLVAGLFWATNSFAWSFGGSLAYDDATRLADRPEVVLYTGDRLLDLPEGVVETTLAGDGEPQFRYGGLRLLLRSEDRLFLVPAVWTEQSRTLVLPYGDDLRIHLVPAG